MYRRVIFFKIVLAIVLVAVIIGGGLAVYRLGWGQGYLVGTAQASSEVVEPGLMVPAFGGHLYRPFYPGFGFPFFGLCLGIGFIFLVMFLVGGLLRPWGRRGWAGHRHHGKWAYGPIPPWAKEWDEFQKYKHGQKETGEESSEDQTDFDE